MIYVYAIYLKHVINVSDNLGIDNVIRLDFCAWPNERIVCVVDIAENMLNNSEKSERITLLLFENISERQWKALNAKKHTNEAIIKYFSYIDDKVMIMCFVCFNVNGNVCMCAICF